jgi:hypothetical protein
VTAAPDRFASARAVADAVLYEGYVLYPYRASSRKNQVRFQFGVLIPRSYSESDGFERWSVRTECLVRAGTSPVLSVRIRCLQLQHRAVEEAIEAFEWTDGEPHFAHTATLRTEGRTYIDWDEAVDQTVDLPPLGLSALLAESYEHPFDFPGGIETEVVRSKDSKVVGRIIRRREPIDGRVQVGAVDVDDVGDEPLVRIRVTVENVTEHVVPGETRDQIMAHSLVAVHTMMAVDGGVFVSLLDPPETARSQAAGCRGDGTFPVLIGNDDVVLSSPIILYDHPEIAPESPGDLYDSTEIDEILALRVLTLTDEEKAEAKATDPRAAQIIDRCDDMPPEMWSRLHGALRSLGPLPDTVARPGGEVWPGVEARPDGGPEQTAWWDPAADASFDPWSDSVTVAGVEITKGVPVRLWPSHRSDAQDLFLHGMTATVAGVFHDVDGDAHVAVTVDDDPATEELSWQGRYLFFHPDEVEPLNVPDRSR